MLRDSIVNGVGIHLKKIEMGLGIQVQRATQADPSPTDRSGPETGQLEAVTK